MQALKKGMANQIIKISFRTPVDESEKLNISFIDYDGNVIKDTEYTVSLLSWSLTQPAGAGTQNPKQIILSNYSGLLSDRYFIINEAFYEKVKVLYTDGTKAVLAYPITTYFGSGSVLKPAFFNAIIPAEVVENEKKITAKIQYLDVFGNIVGYYIDVYVTQNPALNPATLDDIEKVWPQILNMQQPNAGKEEMAEKLDAAWNSVTSRLLSAGIFPEQVHAVTLLKEIVVYEFAKLLALSGSDPTGQKNPFDFSEKVTAILNAKWDEFFTTKQYVDTNKTNKKDEPMMHGRRVEW